MIVFDRFWAFVKLKRSCRKLQTNENVQVMHFGKNKWFQSRRKDQKQQFVSLNRNGLLSRHNKTIVLSKIIVVWQ